MKKTLILFINNTENSKGLDGLAIFRQHNNFKRASYENIGTYPILKFKQLEFFLQYKAKKTISIILRKIFPILC